ncbi:LOW QUALITY PROTEIN: solute carrier family 22 member 7-like [Anableps anableps]
MRLCKDTVNGFGKFQVRTILLLVIPRVTLTFHFLLNNFITVIPSHHRNISSLDHGERFRNLSLEDKIVVSTPLQSDGSKSLCHMFAEPKYHLLYNSTILVTTIPCQNGWVYDHSTFKFTLATEWDLVCDKRSMNRATATIFFMGVMVGAAAFGYHSDRFGRKRTLLVSYITTAIFGFASAFSYNFPMFAAMRFFTGFGISGISIVSIVLSKLSVTTSENLPFSSPETLNVHQLETIEEHRTDKKEATMKFENVLADINGFGKYQIMIIAINFLGRFTLPCHFMLNNFVAAIPAHHCDISSMDVSLNLSQAERITVSVPVETDGSPSSCRMFVKPQYHLLLNSSDVTDASTVPCQNGWVYDNTTFKSTITSEWDLVCDRRGKNKATATIFFVGVMFGAISFGSLSDRFGRRIMLLVSYVSGMLFAVASVFSTSYVMFAVLRFFTGFCITGIVIVSAALSVEWVDIEHRKLVGVIDSLSWTFGNIVFAAIGYFVTDWRWLILSVTSPLILAIITWRWMPDSARWLIANGKLEQAQTYLKKCAKMNRREDFSHTLKPETLATIVVSETKGRTYTYLDLIRTPKMRKLALQTGLLWFFVATTFYGISFNITGFGLNIYLTHFIYALIELPAKLLVYYLLDKIGRRSTEVGALLLSALCLGINIVIPKDLSVARTVVAVVGKGFSSASFGTVVLYSSELYPTVVRQNGMGYNSFMARFGVAVSPLILLLDDVWKELPQVVLCSTAILGGLVARTLAETRNRCLPETIEDIEEM